MGRHRHHRARSSGLHPTTVNIGHRRRLALGQLGLELLGQQLDVERAGIRRWRSSSISSRSLPSRPRRWISSLTTRATARLIVRMALRSCRLHHQLGSSMKLAPPERRPGCQSRAIAMLSVWNRLLTGVPKRPNLTPLAMASGECPPGASLRCPTSGSSVRSRAPSPARRHRSQ